jgi:hypothetical protein
MNDTPTSGRLRCRVAVPWPLLVTFALAQCASHPDLQTTGSVPEELAFWEQRVDGAIENRGIALVERLNTRWVLTVRCQGRHSVYLDETTLDLERHEGAYVQARYTYVDRLNDEVRCVRPPCPPVLERLVALERLTRVPASDDDAAEREAACRIAHPPLSR